MEIGDRVITFSAPSVENKRVWRSYGTGIYTGMQVPYPNALGSASQRAVKASQPVMAFLLDSGETVFETECSVYRESDKEKLNIDGVTVISINKMRDQSKA